MEESKPISFNLAKKWPTDDGDKKTLKSLFKHSAIDGAYKSLADVYKNVERRELEEGEYGAEDLQLGEVYSSLLVSRSVAAPAEQNEEEDEARGIFRLPSDDGIFVDGIPFHHYTLTPLQDKHHHRLLKNGIEISKRKFTLQEDAQLLRNWKEYAEMYGISEKEGPSFMGASFTHESNEVHRERMQLFRRTHFRPWMCKRLLNRTCAQVFRRCYFLFRDDREWSVNDDKEMIQLYKNLGNSWEEIGTKLCRTRYSCKKRYVLLMKEKISSESSDGICIPPFNDNLQATHWTKLEVVQLYQYLSRNLEHHPVLVATLSEYHQSEEKLTWKVSSRKFWHKSVEECKAKWKEIKLELRLAKETLKTDIMEDVERAVFPNSQLLCGSLANKRITISLTPLELADVIDALISQFNEQAVYLNKFNLINKEDFSQRISKILTIPYEVENIADRVLRRIRYITHLCTFYKLFNTIPVDYDNLEVRMKLISYILRKTRKFEIRKKKIRKYIRHYIQAQGWTPRPRILYVDNCL